MGISSIDKIIELLTTSTKNDKAHFWRESITVDAINSPHQLWQAGGLPSTGASPGTNRVCTRDTAGCIARLANGAAANKSWLTKFGVNGDIRGSIMLIDRLVDTEGLSGTVTTPQTTNLPTPALTRYTTGEGVWAALVCWTPTGTGVATVTASYTNQAGTSGRTTTSTVLFTGNWSNGVTAPTTNQLHILPLQVPDRGVQALASVTLSASTGTPGNFGVMLFKPLAIVSFSTETETIYNERDLTVSPPDLIQKFDNACLDLIIISSAPSASGDIIGTVEQVME